jgi:hypothetical protein
VRADAITGTSNGVTATAPESSEPTSTTREDQSTAATFNGFTLFDGGGLSLLVITPSRSLDLFGRDKLRGGGALSDGVLAGLGSGVSSSSLSNVSFQSGGDPVAVISTVGIATAAPEPATLLLLASGIAMAARRLRRAR